MSSSSSVVSKALITAQTPWLQLCGCGRLASDGDDDEEAVGILEANEPFRPIEWVISAGAGSHLKPSRLLVEVDPDCEEDAVDCLGSASEKRRVDCRLATMGVC